MIQRKQNDNINKETHKTCKERLDKRIKKKKDVSLSREEYLLKKTLCSLFNNKDYREREKWAIQGLIQLKDEKMMMTPLSLE